MDRAWWKPLMILLALASGALVLLMMMGREPAAMLVMPATALVVSILSLVWWVALAPRKQTSPFFTRPGCCPDCGFLAEGLEGQGCPECGNVLPAGNRHMTALLAAHSADGPSECVVCGLRADGPGRCPSCGSRHRRPIRQATA